MIRTCTATERVKMEPDVGFDAARWHLGQTRCHLKLCVCGVLVDHGCEQPSLAAIQRPQALIQRHDLVCTERNPFRDVYLHVAARGRVKRKTSARQRDLYAVNGR